MSYCKARAAKRSFIKKAPPDHPVYKLGFIIGAKKLKHHSLIARVKESKVDEKEGKNGR